MTTGLTPAVSRATGLTAPLSGITGALVLDRRVVASESFVAANGTLITALAKPWTKHVAGSTNAIAPSIDNNLVHGEDTLQGSLYYRADWVSTNADYDVTQIVVLRTDNSASQAGPAGRIDPAANTLYYAHYQTSTDGWQLAKRIAGAGTTLGSAAFAPVADQRYSVTLRMRGSLIQMFVDGVLIASVTDATIPGPGFAGLRIASNATATVGIHLGAWQVLQ